MAASAYLDAQANNNSDRNLRQYADLDLFFSKKNSDSDINKVTDIQAVKRSVRNLVLLNHYEKPFHPEIGSNLRGMLFEIITPQMTHFIGKQIELLIKNYEPRCKLVEVKNKPNLERNGYSVSISFYVVNHSQPVQVETFLERLR